MTLNDFSRRKFVKASSVLSSGVALSAPFIAKASPKNNSETLKIGLIGIGGRGSGAAAQAMTADDNVALTAIGDLFEDRIKLRSRILKARGRDKYQVTPETTFTGFDAYKKVIDSGVDVVILTSLLISALSIWNTPSKKVFTVFSKNRLQLMLPGYAKL